MTIQAAIDRIDALKPNMFSTQQKIAWLSELDGLVWKEIIMTHEGVPEGVIYEGYDEETAPDVELLVHAPYTDIYQHYLAAQMDIANRETNEYTKDMMLFNSAWETFSDYWTRLHMPISRVKEYRF